MTTQAIAEKLVSLWKAGKFMESGETYWDDAVVSIEPSPDAPESIGKEAARGKGQWWENAHDVHSVQVDGPWVNGDQFTVRFTMDVTVKETGVRLTMDEIGLYTLRGGRIVEERFFYNS
ncbi:MAG: ketosteroid isomerase [Phenylobacterium zucineum]|nr:MAG: ketosteroid isomerase [Phenylobacterium zucineum]